MFIIFSRSGFRNKMIPSTAPGNVRPRIRMINNRTYGNRAVTYTT